MNNAEVEFSWAAFAVIGGENSRRDTTMRDDYSAALLKLRMSTSERLESLKLAPEDEDVGREVLGEVAHLTVPQLPGDNLSTRGPHHFLLT